MHNNNHLPGRSFNRLQSIYSHVHPIQNLDIEVSTLNTNGLTTSSKNKMVHTNIVGKDRANLKTISHSPDFDTENVSNHSESLQHFHSHSLLDPSLRHTHIHHTHSLSHHHSNSNLIQPQLQSQLQSHLQLHPHHTNHSLLPTTLFDSSYSQQTLSHSHPSNFSSVLIKNPTMQSTSTAPQNNPSSHLFGFISEAPVDPILSMTQRFKDDKDPSKVDLGVGAYRDDNGKPFVLRAVREAEKSIVQDALDKEYIPQDGNRRFSAEAIKLLYGKELISSLGGKVVALQTISGTGALCVGFNFLSQFIGKDRPIYFPNPTWGNHQKMAAQAGFKNICSYKYYNPENRGFTLEGMLNDLNNAPEGSIILLHLCAHNPTGVDPTPEQWKKIYESIKQRKHIAFFDSAYQGFASGDLERDAFALRYFVSQGLEVFASQSFAKNMGMYGERVGCLSVVSSDATVSKNILSQLMIIVRTLYSSPPIHGARIVERILTNEKLYNLWIEDLVFMSNRIKEMRSKLYNRLLELKTPGDWKHIINQIGMFSFTGLDVKQSNRMIEKYHIYMLTNGRISMAGLNTKNIDYVAEAIHDCVTFEYN